MYLPTTPKDDEFIKRGYHAYAPLAIDNSSIKKRFQKRFDDDTGKKYFIDILCWDNSYIPLDYRGQYYEPYTYEYETSINVSDKPINLTFHNSWTIEQVEQYVEKMFQLGLFDYYEKYSED